MLRERCYSSTRKRAPTIVVETGFPLKNSTRFVNSSVDSSYQSRRDPRNRPFSALISSLMHPQTLPRKSFGNIRITPANRFPSKPESHPKPPISPRITARQEIFRSKRGVLASDPRDARVVVPADFLKQARFQRTMWPLFRSSSSLPRTLVGPVAFRELLKA